MDFIQQYFIDPIIYNTGYNIVNTATYAIILVASIFIVYRLLQKLSIKIDRNFFVGIVPFIILGGILRSYEDLLEATGLALTQFSIVDAFGVTRNLLLVSPLMYITMFVIALLALLVAILLKNKIPYWKTWFAIGIILDIAVLSQLRFSSGFALVATISITLAWLAVIMALRYVAIKKDIKKIRALLTGENILIIMAHMFEASTTFVAIQFPAELGVNYFEQHVVAGFLINTLGAWSFFLLKLAIVPVVLYYFDKEFAMKENEQEKKTFLKIIVLILGTGPGIRNFLRMVMGV